VDPKLDVPKVEFSRETQVAWAVLLTKITVLLHLGTVAEAECKRAHNSETGEVWDLREA